MDKAVQVGLVFPRSGQRVMVTIPIASARHLGIHQLDAKTPPILTHHPERGTQLFENATHAQ